MIRIAVTGDIGSGKSFISRLFGYPVFNADEVVSKIYSKDKSTFLKLKKKFPEFFFEFPIKKRELIKAILKNKNNLEKITSIVHPIVKRDLALFLKKNKNKKLIILDIPLYLENKLYKKKDIIIFIDANKKKILKKIKTRKNFNNLIYLRLKKLQYSLKYKKKRSHFIIKNNFDKNSARKRVKDIINIILK